MKKSVSPSMQKYVGAYVQQNAGNFAGQASSPVVSPMTHVNPVAQNGPSSIHFEQTHDPSQEINQPDETKVDTNPYEFIETSNDKPVITSKRGRIMRIGLLIIVIIIALFAFSFIKKLASGPSNYVELKQIVFTQQQIIGLSKKASAERTVTADNLNYVSTTLYSVQSSQSALIQYMIKNGKKVPVKELVLAKDTTAETQLTQSLSSSSYNAVLVPIMREKLIKYQSDIKKAYDKTKGAKGRALLEDEYKQAYLLQQQFK